MAAWCRSDRGRRRTSVRPLCLQLPSRLSCWLALFEAERASWNSIGLFKLSNISGKRREVVKNKSAADGSEIGSDGSDSDGDDEEEELCGSQTPVLQFHRVAHEGCVNRIRSMTQSPHICASWADTGHVQGIARIVFTCGSLHLVPHGILIISRLLDMLQVLKIYKSMGGAWITWLAHYPGTTSNRLWAYASGAQQKPMYLPPVPWIAIWDTRLGKSPAASIKAHKADVNVMSWNRLVSCMLASGCDDGSFSIRDLRLLKDGDSVVAHFEYHRHPITSIKWSPDEASTLAVSSSDNQLTIWDLSLEKDEEEEAEFKARTREQVNAPRDLPPQLLFVHQGQKDLKELHWPTQIPGMILSTAADGFNLLMPSNL